MARALTCALAALALALLLAGARTGGGENAPRPHTLARVGPALPSATYPITPRALSEGRAHTEPGELAPTTVCHIGGKTQMLCLHNWVRRQHGLRPLAASATLYWVAGKKADRIAECGAFTHFPCGDEPFLLWPPASYSLEGENLAYGYLTVRATFAGWLSSPGHRANILNPAFSVYGSAFRAAGAFPRLWAVELGRPLGQP